jgi:hypothetical protein
MPGGLARAGYHPPQLNVVRSSGFGDYYGDAALISPVPVVGQAGAVLFTAAGLLQSFTGGSAVDQQRQARVNYFLQQALQGNVAAAQLILGGPSNVSGNESSMWTQAAQSLGSTAVGRQTLDEARQLGPAWLVGSGDTATNYPAMKAFTQQWALANQPVTTAVNAIFGPSTGGTVRAAAGAIPSWLLIGGAAVAAYVLLGSRRRG